MPVAENVTEMPQNTPSPQILRVEGMHCASCVGRAETALRAVPGVTDARVQLIAEQAVVTGDVAADALVRALAAIGYAAHVVRDAAAEAATRAAAQAAARRALARDFALAALLTLPIFVVEMGSHIFPALHHFLSDTIGMARVQMVQALLTTILLLLPGARFFRVGLPALWRLSWSSVLDVLRRRGHLGGHVLSGRPFLLLRLVYEDEVEPVCCGDVVQHYELEA